MLCRPQDVVLVFEINALGRLIDLHVVRRVSFVLISAELCKVFLQIVLRYSVLFAASVSALPLADVDSCEEDAEDDE